MERFQSKTNHDLVFQLLKPIRRHIGVALATGGCGFQSHSLRTRINEISIGLPLPCVTFRHHKKVLKSYREYYLLNFHYFNFKQEKKINSFTINMIEIYFISEKYFQDLVVIPISVLFLVNKVKLLKTTEKGNLNRSVYLTQKN